MSVSLRRTLELLLLLAAVGIATPFLIELGKGDARRMAESLGVAVPGERAPQLYPVEADARK